MQSMPPGGALYGPRRVSAIRNRMVGRSSDRSDTVASLKSGRAGLVSPSGPRYTQRAGHCTSWCGRPITRRRTVS